MTFKVSKLTVVAAIAVAMLLGPGVPFAAAKDAEVQAAKETPAVAQPAEVAKKDVNEWPCVWRKVVELGAATIWDGPALDKADGWHSDDAIRNLSAYLIARRHKVEDVEAAIKKYADALGAETKDAKLTELFAAVLSRTNDERKLVISGIERFHKRQVARAAEITKQGGALPPSASDAEASGAPAQIPQDAAAADKVSDADEKLKWEIRVFQERQQNIPLACEIPQLMDERAGAIARAIRAQMKS